MGLRWVLSLLELSTIVSLSCRSLSWRSENRVLGQLGLFRPPEANWMFGRLGALVVGAEHHRLNDLPTVSSCSCAASVSQSVLNLVLFHLVQDPLASVGVLLATS